MEQSAYGLHHNQIAELRKRYGYNTIEKHTATTLEIFTRQFATIFNLILIMAVVISAFTGDLTNATIIFFMIFASGILGFINEYKSDQSIKRLAKAIKFHSIVERDGVRQEIDSSELLPGDYVYIETGTIIPADIELITAEKLEINEAALTGESFPVVKKQGDIALMGTTAINGAGSGLVKKIATMTEYGEIAATLEQNPPPTSFEKGITSFSMMVFKIIIVMTFFIFVSNAIFKHNILDAFLFSLAIAIGLTPELLPAVITVSLANGMKILLKHKVIVKHMPAIENLGNMSILCTDKTGTLTEGVVHLSELFPVNHVTEHDLLSYALVCNEAVLHPRLRGNQIDVSIWQYALEMEHQPSLAEYIKINEVPFDFEKRVMYSLIKNEGKLLLIVKGAPEEIFKLTTDETQDLEQHFHDLTRDGKRVICLGIQEVNNKDVNIFAQHKFKVLGLISFEDKVKKSAKASLQTLERLGVEIKILTGDNELVTKQICEELQLPVTGIVTGKELTTLTQAAFNTAVVQNTIFAKITPSQKAKIIMALKSLGHTVGFMGDGINDATSLKLSDVAISVDTAVDVAKDVADVVLLDKSLKVLADGIIEGRKTFANTTKYILMNISSNFGNMFSMAGASLLLPFLPMLPGQILLNNLMYDASQLALPTDRVDDDYVKKPKEWDIKFIRKFMIMFGPISSLFDFTTFGVLLFIFHANEQFFHTGWFIESFATQMLVVFVIRTKVIPFFKSRPSWELVASVVTLLIIAVGLTISPFSVSLGFMALPLQFWIYLVFALFVYLILVELMKYFFYKNLNKEYM